jgi:hypothetical protein
METLNNNQGNQSQPPIDEVPAPVTPDITPKKRNYLPWILGILAVVVIFTTSFLILIGKSKPTPIGSLTQQNSSSPSPTINFYACVTKYEKLDLYYPTNTTGWKTYVDSTQSYSFKYPNTLNLLKDKRLSLSTQTEVDQSCEFGCVPSYGMDVETPVENGDPQQNLKDYVTKTLDMPTCEQSGDRITTVRLYRTINLNNKYDAVYFQFNDCGGGSCDNFIVKDKTTGNIARFMSMNLSEDLFNQVFSTFKFIDTTTAPSE